MKSKPELDREHLNYVKDCPLNSIELPIFYDEEFYKNKVIPELLKKGAISKQNLEPGVTYLGICRNASEAVWNGELFEYKRYKFGEILYDTIQHFEEFTEYDVFIPYQKKED